VKPFLALVLAATLLGLLAASPAPSTTVTLQCSVAVVSHAANGVSVVCYPLPVATPTPKATAARVVK
jgi:hypothetical protein